MPCPHRARRLSPGASRRSAAGPSRHRPPGPSRHRPPKSRSLSPATAIALGALQGPAELLPISSSAHVALVSRLLGGVFVDFEDDFRKTFEVALHAGTLAARAAAWASDGGRGAPVGQRGDWPLLAVSSLPPAVTGYLLERAIERRFGTPATIAAGLAGGALLMLAADRAAAHRSRSDAGLLDALCIGIAQACALIPGVSRDGATLAAARLRHFAPREARYLSRRAGLPVLAGASALKLTRLWRRGLRPGEALSLGAGAGAAFTCTLVLHKPVARLEGERSLTPYALYRLALAGTVALGAVRSRA